MRKDEAKVRERKSCFTIIQYQICFSFLIFQLTASPFSLR